MTDDLTRLQRRAERERIARKEAEHLLEERSLALYLADEHLKLELERNRLILDSAADIVMVANSQRHLTYANRQAMEMLGYGVGELLAMEINDLVPEDEHDLVAERVGQLLDQGRLRAEVNLRRSDGIILPVEMNAVCLQDGSLFASFRDISDRKVYEARLKYLATHDALTGLANRNLLNDRMEQSIIFARRSERRVAAMLLDLDRFKLINDSLGHDTGDALLCETANRLAAVVRPGDTVARLGGDEFMVVMSDMAAEDDAMSLARKVLDAVAQPMMAAGHDVVTTGSLGIAFFPRDGESTAELLRNADVAMYRAKDLGGNSFQFYAPNMNARLLERLQMEGDLRRALERSELELYFQPKVTLQKARNIVGAEALLRWNHPVMGQVAPGDFIPLAEDTGLILPIGEWVIGAACRQIRAWQDQGLPNVTVAVNISARQFQHGNLIQMISGALRENGVHPQYLELELTESAIMANPERTASVLRDIKKIGVQVSLDDFGTGYSSLNYLKRFPIDRLKIDQSFIRDITTEPDDAAIARTVITLAHSLNQTVVAEGVETEAQLNMLSRLECDEIQGYLFSRPLPAAEFAALVRTGRRLAPAVELPGPEQTLLIVDDEPGILSSLKRLLRPDGYRILTAGGGPEGFELLARNDVQVIISDQRMPQMNGTEFLSRVRKLYPETIRILLTGYTDIQSVTEAVNQGAVLKFLTKPWDDRMLREHVRDAFRYHRSSVGSHPSVAAAPDGTGEDDAGKP